MTDYSRAFPEYFFSYDYDGETGVHTCTVRLSAVGSPVLATGVGQTSEAARVDALRKVVSA